MILAPAVNLLFLAAPFFSSLSLTDRCAFFQLSKAKNLQVAFCLSGMGGQRYQGKSGGIIERLALIPKRGITLDRIFSNSMVTRITIFHKTFIIILLRG